VQQRSAVALHNILAQQPVAYLADEIGMGKTHLVGGRRVRVTLLENDDIRSGRISTVARAARVCQRPPATSSLDSCHGRLRNHGRRRQRQGDNHERGSNQWRGHRHRREDLGRSPSARDRDLIIP
jgi:hypothetical protein